MNLSELKKYVDNAIESAIEYGDTPENVTVSVQIDGPEPDESVYADDVELHYDNDTQASGCVILGVADIPTIKIPWVNNGETKSPHCNTANASKDRVIREAASRFEPTPTYP